MEQDNHQERESIGALFRRLRLERSLEIADVSAETKIPPDKIRAMEADDFEALPALAFARGFYNLYASMLGLEPELVVRRFLREYNQAHSSTPPEGVSPPSWQTEEIGTIASRPSNTIGTVVGIGLLVLILLGATLSWYAGYNPATQVSKWLRGFQQPAVEEQVPEPQTTQPEAPQEPEQQPVTEVAPSGEQAPAVLSPVEQEENGESMQYVLIAEFQDGADISVAIDDGPPRDFSLSSGTIRTWQAKESIELTMPAGATVRLFLNGIAVPLPPADGDTITVNIPEYLLD